MSDTSLTRDQKRERDSRRKWALGEAAATPGHPSKRPVKVVTPANGKMPKREVGFCGAGSVQIPKISRKHRSPYDNDTSTSNSSAEEDVREASAAPEPDAGISYSFDAPRGPGKGDEILGQALARAVEKFETKETEKLIKDEYEIIAKEKEEGLGGYTADEDDFELV